MNFKICYLSVTEKFYVDTCNFLSSICYQATKTVRAVLKYKKLLHKKSVQFRFIKEISISLSYLYTRLHIPFS